MLGRKLNKEECVHHKDRNRSNNSPDNLMVFKTKSDHTAYHNGSEIYLDGDVWVAMPSKNLICPICKENIKSNDARMCSECFLIFKASNIPQKEELESLIYKYSFTQKYQGFRYKIV